MFSLLDLRRPWDMKSSPSRSGNLHLYSSSIILKNKHRRARGGASGQTVVTGVVPSPPRFLPSTFIAQRVQQSHCPSIFYRMLLTYALALSASQTVHTKNSPRIYMCTINSASYLVALLLAFILILDNQHNTQHTGYIIHVYNLPSVNRGVPLTISSHLPNFARYIRNLRGTR